MLLANRKRGVIRQPELLGSHNNFLFDNKVVPVLKQALHYEDVWGNGGIATRILNLDRWK
jgi:hypothetical protein